MTDISETSVSRTETAANPRSEGRPRLANLGFSLYQDRPALYRALERRGWDAGHLTEDNVLHIAEGSTALHYGQQCFEGMKAYACADDSVNLFRPDMNAARMQRSCDRLLMPQVPEEMFSTPANRWWPPTCASCRRTAPVARCTCAPT